MLERLKIIQQDSTDSKEAWTITFEVTKPVDDTEDGIIEQAQIQIEIFQVPDQDKYNKYCVEFKRKGGSTQLFNEAANKYIDMLLPCNNATLKDDDEVDGAAAATQQKANHSVKPKR